MEPAQTALREVFDEAAEIADPAARAVFLDSACRGNDTLRARVEELLRAEARASEFLRDRSDSREADRFSEKIGERIGRYRLRERIGRGGCGVVYLAEQEEPVRREVALKVIKLGMDTRSVVARFEAERQTLALMDHPNIARVLDAGATETGRPYFVMELVRGVPITDYCAHHELSFRQRLELFIQICQAVQHAHQKGIIHRDLKPSNILVATQDGGPVPKVIDFGIAKATEQGPGNATLTNLNQFIGTPAYMSPEQVGLGAGDVDTRSDIYSLGVILYELVAGQPPFDPKTLTQAGLDEMRRIIREVEPVKPSTRITQDLVAASRQSAAVSLSKDGGALPRRRYAQTQEFIHALRGDMDWIVMKCLEKDRARRYETANGLALDIRRHLENEPVVARPPTALYRFQKTVRRHRVGFTAVTVVSLILVLAAVVSSRLAVRARQAEVLAMRRLTESVASEARAVKATEETRRRAYASDINLAQQALAENNLGRARELLGRQRPSSVGEVDLRGWEWRYLWQQCRSDALFRLARDQGGVAALAASQDGRWLAVGGHGGAQLTLWDLTARREVKLLANGVTSLCTVFSPTEPILAYSSTSNPAGQGPVNRLRLWNTATQGKAGEWLLPGICMGLAFSADGQSLLTVIREPEAQFVLWNVRDRTVRSALPTTARMYNTIGTSFAANRDLSRAAVGVTDHRIRVTDLTSGKVAWEAQPGVNTALAIDPAGTTLAAGIRGIDSFIQLYSLATGQEIGKLPVRNGYIISLQFTPEGKTLLAAGSDQTITHWDVGNWQPLATLRGHTLEVWRLTLLADGKTLVSGSGDGDVLVWNLQNAGMHDFRATLPIAGRVCWRFAQGSDAILTCERNGSVTRWTGRDFQDGQTLLKLDTKPVSMALSEDGGNVAATFPNGLIRVWDLNTGSLRREFNSGSDAAEAWGFANHSNCLLVVNKLDQSLHEWDLLAGVERTPSKDLTDWRVRGSYPPGSHQRSTTKTVTQRFAALAGAQRPPEMVTRLFGGAFSPDDRYFARSLPMSVVEIDSAETGQLLGRVRGFLHGVHSLAFSPDSQRLAAGSDDRQAVKLWDLPSLQELVTLRGEARAFSETHFSPDGNLLGTMNPDGVLHVWRAPSAPDIEAAERSRAEE